MIDPGHGGENPGARGAGGTLEKDVALSIARKLKAELVNARGLSVFLTRDRDLDVGLDERTAIANNYKADLFVSIHANASRARGAKGSEVYFLSYQASDDESRWVAQTEGAAEPVAGATPGSDLALILWDMAQAEHLEESSALASRIQEELAVVTGSEGRGVKQAPFRVLVGAAMPAVLVEVAFISNPEEEKLLASEAYQAKIAGSLARGIERFRKERSARLGGAACPPRRARRDAAPGERPDGGGSRRPPGHGGPDRAALGGAPAGAGRVPGGGGARGGGGAAARGGRPGGGVRAADQRAALLRGSGSGRPPARGARGGLLGRPGAAAPDRGGGAREGLDDGPRPHAAGGDARPRGVRAGARRGLGGPVVGGDARASPGARRPSC